jgi:hypothetical protein
MEVLGSELDEGLGAEDARVIHQNIDASEVRDRCFRSFDRRFLFTDVAVNENQFGRGSQ